MSETTSAGPAVVMLICSFCGKNHKQVRQMVAGPTAFICNECIAVCVDVILGAESPNPRTPTQPKETT